MNNCKPALSITTGDCNARSQSWCSNDVNTTVGSKLHALSSSNGFSQLKMNQHIYKQTAPLVLI